MAFRVYNSGDDKRNNQDRRNDDDIMDVILGLKDQGSPKSSGRSNIINLSEARREVGRKAKNNAEQNARRQNKPPKKNAAAAERRKQYRSETDRSKPLNADIKPVQKSKQKQTQTQSIFKPDNSRQTAKPSDVAKHHASRYRWQSAANILTLVCIGLMLVYIRFGYSATWLYPAACISFCSAIVCVIKQARRISFEEKRLRERNLRPVEQPVMFTAEKKSDNSEKDDDIIISDADLLDSSSPEKVTFPDNVNKLQDQMMLYIRDEKDVFTFTDWLFKCTSDKETADEINAEKVLFNALALYIWNVCPPSEQRFSVVIDLLSEMAVNVNALDSSFSEIGDRYPTDTVIKEYRLFDRCLDTEQKADAILSLSEKLNFLKGNISIEPAWKRSGDKSEISVSNEDDSDKDSGF